MFPFARHDAILADTQRSRESHGRLIDVIVQGGGHVVMIGLDVRVLAAWLAIFPLESTGQEKVI